MSGSVGVAPDGMDRQAEHDVADAAPPVSGSPAARAVVDPRLGDAPPDSAGGLDSGEPLPGEDDEDGRYVPL